MKNYFNDNEYIINNNVSIQELYELLQNATLCDIIKLPPRLVLTIKGTNYHQTFFICDNYIKDDKRKIYRCKKNIEKELKKIIKDNRSHNGLERSEWQAVYRKYSFLFVFLSQALHYLQQILTFGPYQM